MARWQTPDLPDGPLRTLNRELHALHKKASYPSARELHLAVDQAVSHTKIHHAFTRPVLPTWGVVELVVEHLAKRARPRLDPEAEIDRFKALWDEVHGPGSEAGHADPVGISPPPASEVNARHIPRRLRGPLGQLRTRKDNDPPGPDRSEEPTVELVALLNLIRRYMAELGWSYTVMGRNTNASASTWNRWCTQMRLPHRDALLSFADAAPRVVNRDELLSLWDAAWDEDAATPRRLGTR